MKLFIEDSHDGHDAVPLTGGNSNEVLRIQNTVRRRSAGLQVVYDLLEFLEGHEFPSSRFLGLDTLGREVLSYEEGEVGGYPIEPSLQSDDVLINCALLLRRFHDVTQPFLERTRHADWPKNIKPAEQAEVICHRDFAYYNIVFAGTEPRALIDFDTVGPGTRVRDFAYFAYRSVPLSSPKNASAGGWNPTVDIQGRLKLAADTYRLSQEDRLKVVDQACDWLAGAVRFLGARIARGELGLDQETTQAHVVLYKADLAYLRAAQDELTATLVISDSD